MATRWRCPPDSAAGGGLVVKVDHGPSFDVPADRIQRYQGAVGRKLLLGLRPEHMPAASELSNKPNIGQFDVTLDVTEPMGMETLVYFRFGPTELCARVEPNSARGPGEVMRLAADLNHMHLVDVETGRIL